MENRKNLILVLFIFLSVFVQNSSEEKDISMESYVLLDNFNTDVSTLNNGWEGFTDRVMGGKSDIFVRKMSDSEDNYIRMRGQVSIENRGGFIQIKQELSSSLRYFDGSVYEGIRLKVRGFDSAYYIFLRTTATIFPWQFYSAPIELGEEWSYVYIPWTDFEKGDYGTCGKLKVNKLKSLALVAYGKEFNAQIDISEIGFYGESLKGSE